MASNDGVSQGPAKKKKGPPPLLFIVPPSRNPPPAKSPGSPMDLVSPGSPMVLSSPKYYASLHEILSPIDTVMTYLLPEEPFPWPWNLFANLVFWAANCKFDHPGANNQNANPFSVLSGGNNNGGGGGFAKTNSGYGTNTYSLNPETIVKDLTEERPQWILSAYGPGRDAPEQLWGAPVEQSFEEMRLHFELGAAAGNPQGAVSLVRARAEVKPGIWMLNLLLDERHPSPPDRGPAKDTDSDQQSASCHRLHPAGC